MDGMVYQRVTLSRSIYEAAKVIDFSWNPFQFLSSEMNVRNVWNFVQYLLLRFKKLFKLLNRSSRSKFKWIMDQIVLNELVKFRCQIPDFYIFLIQLTNNSQSERQTQLRLRRHLAFVNSCKRFFLFFFYFHFEHNYTWYSPESLGWAEDTFNIHSSEPSGWMAWNRWSFVYVIMPMVIMCKSCLRIHETWR